MLSILLFQLSFTGFSQLELPQKEVSYEEVHTLFQKNKKEKKDRSFIFKRK